MILKSICISDFGKLSDLKITPSENFNIIFAPNESGKTTLLEFIKFVFYGTRQKKTKNDLTFKEKYMPWNGMPMSGSIEFESGGKNYYIYRSEGAKNGSKILEVKNPDTGEKYFGIDNPGEYFFSVDEKVFSDIFFAHDSSALFEPDDSISSAVYGKNESDSPYNRVRRTIEEEILNITSSKRAGSEFSKINKEIKNNQEEKFRLEKELEELDFDLSDLINEKESLEKQRAHLMNQYENSINSKCKSELDEIFKKKNEEQVNINDLKNQLERISKSQSENNVTGTFGMHTVSIVAIVLIMLIVLSLGFVFHNSIFFLFGLMCFVLLFWLYILKRKRIHINNYADDELLRAIATQIESSEKRIFEYNKKIKNEENLIRKDVACGMSQSGETNIFTNEEIDGIINKMQKCEIDISVKKSQILSLSEKKKEIISQMNFCIGKIEEYDLKLGKLKRKQDIYNTALYILDKSFLSLRDCYAPGISRKAFEIFEKVCKKEYISLVADDSFEISLNNGNELKTIKSFSRSTRDAAGLSLRIAICDFISKDNPLPIFFDDVLSSFDDERCSDMLGCMKNISDERQLFLCTCRLRETKLRTECEDIKIIRL